MKIKDYKDLIVWQKAIELSLNIYSVTANLPNSETYGLISQLRRSSVSIASNIAEGAKRNNTPEFRHFLGIANGSAAELETQIIITKSIYKEVELDECKRIVIEIQKMIAGLLKALK